MHRRRYLEPGFSLRLIAVSTGVIVLIGLVVFVVMPRQRPVPSFADAPLVVHVSDREVAVMLDPRYLKETTGQTEPFTIMRFARKDTGEIVYVDGAEPARGEHVIVGPTPPTSSSIGGMKHRWPDAVVRKMGATRCEHEWKVSSHGRHDAATSGDAQFTLRVMWLTPTGTRMAVVAFDCYTDGLFRIENPGSGIEEMSSIRPTTRGSEVLHGT